MANPKFTIGSKNPKKEIDFDVKPRHIFSFFMFLIAIVLIVVQVLSYFSDDISVTCTDNTMEDIVYGQEYYCGKHYSVMKDYLSENKYNKIEAIIYGK